MLVAILAVGTGGINACSSFDVVILQIEVPPLNSATHTACGHEHTNGQISAEVGTVPAQRNQRLDWRETQ